MTAPKRLPPLKRFGQNFLQDKNILQKIVEAAELQPEDTVLEIGMGRGFLTEALASRIKKLITFEIDRGLFAEMSQALGNKHSNIEFVPGDYLELSDKYWQEVTEKAKLVANIPYNLTTPIIEDLLTHRDKLSLAVMMVQKEVAQRLASKGGSKDFGSLSLYVQFHMQVELMTQVSRNCFYPPPNVDSAVIRLTPLAKPPVEVVSKEKMFKIIRGAFWGRRKTLRNTLKKSPYTHYTEEMLAMVPKNIDLNRRGETLSLQEYADITNAIFG